MSLFEELKKPFNVLNVAIAVVSLFLSIYFYFESRQKREPVYISHGTSQIYSKTNSSPKLRFLDQDGKPIEGDVHVLEVSLWNHGRQPIELADIRTPVYIEFPTKTRILDYSIARQNKPDISAFQLLEVAAKPAGSPRVGIRWLHLDPGLGARMQFIYVGEKNPPIKFGGDILDANIENGASYAGRFGGTGGEAIMLGLFGVFLGQFSKSAYKRISPNQPAWRRRAVAITLFAITYGSFAFIYWFFFTGKTAPI